LTSVGIFGKLGHFPEIRIGSDWRFHLHEEVRAFARQRKVQESSGKLLSRKMEQAARQVAEDRLTDVEVAAECGVTDRTLYRWKKREEFIARVNAMVQAALHKNSEVCTKSPSQAERS